MMRGPPRGMKVNHATRTPGDVHLGRNARIMSVYAHAVHGERAGRLEVPPTLLAVRRGLIHRLRGGEPCPG
eukprot:969813-Alexandrium_andersonii.AAC.1